MGILVEFNPDLALREYGSSGRLPEECLPENIEVGSIYEFLKKGQRNYWLDGAIPLCTTSGNGRLSRPIAAISILESTHIKIDEDKIWTSGSYGVHAIFDPKESEIHFEGMEWVK
ncbi:MAG TPA: hypothetical protein VJH37_03915 [Candidatus Nanoarchaeia archaeon]|nr:hypothetical protein [Candidatus Nanoarchaeia archaeon]